MVATLVMDFLVTASVRMAKNGMERPVSVLATLFGLLNTVSVSQMTLTSVFLTHVKFTPVAPTHVRPINPMVLIVRPSLPQMVNALQVSAVLPALVRVIVLLSIPLVQDVLQPAPTLVRVLLAGGTLMASGITDASMRTLPVLRVHISGSTVLPVTGGRLP
jgi:hypothetical protein